MRRVRADQSVIIITIRIRNIIITVTRNIISNSTSRQQRLCTERKRFIHETLKFVFRILFL